MESTTAARSLETEGQHGADMATILAAIDSAFLSEAGAVAADPSTTASTIAAAAAPQASVAASIPTPRPKQKPPPPRGRLILDHERRCALFFPEDDEEEEEETSMARYQGASIDNNTSKEPDNNKDQFTGHNKRSLQWEAQFQNLVRYKLKLKDSNGKISKIEHVPMSMKRLNVWVKTQRRLYREGKLSKERISRLESIGMVWNVNKLSTWMEYYNFLVAYQRKHKTTRVSWKESERLGRWVYMQRKYYHRGTLSKERVLRLESIGFDWKMEISKEALWDAMYNHLVAYKTRHGDTLVPYDDRGLGRWVTLQRCHCRDPHRIRRLNEIGFVWNTMHKKWMTMYGRLVAYKSKHGHTRVPCDWEEDPQLGAWVGAQRVRCKDEDMIRCLNEIGFEWNTSKQTR